MKQLSLALALAAGCALVAQTVDEAATARIRSEELEHSMMMHTEHMLTDRFGPRMTGTPNHEAAVDWVIKETTSWGMKNAHKEAWDFGHPGWLNERASGFITAPVKENLKFEVLAWTPSTKGTVTGSAIQLIRAARSRNSAHRRCGQRARAADVAEGAAALNSRAQPRPRWISGSRGTRMQCAAKMVMVGKAAVIPVDFNPPRSGCPMNRPRAVDAAAAISRWRRTRARRRANDGRLTARQVTDAIDTMLLANGALVRINDAARGQGIIVAQQNPTYAPEKTDSYGNSPQ